MASARAAAGPEIVMKIPLSLAALMNPQTKFTLNVERMLMKMLDMVHSPSRPRTVIPRAALILSRNFPVKRSRLICVKCGSLAWAIRSINSCRNSLVNSLAFLLLSSSFSTLSAVRPPISASLMSFSASVFCVFFLPMTGVSTRLMRWDTSFLRASEMCFIPSAMTGPMNLSACSLVRPRAWASLPTFASRVAWRS